MTRPVQIVSSSGRVLASYPSAQEASRKTGLDRCHISRVCRKKQAHVKGFTFRFSDKDTDLNELTMEELLEARGDEAASKKRRRSSKKFADENAEMERREEEDEVVEEEDTSPR